MGEMADYANEQQGDSLEDLLDYQSGNMSKEEAMDYGIIDETGAEPSGPLLWGVHDVSSLEALLDKDSLLLSIDRRIERDPNDYWISQGKILKITGMSTSHLRNAIAFFERTNKESHQVIKNMKNELKKRNE